MLIGLSYIIDRSVVHTRGDSKGRREAGQKIFMRDDQCTERDTTERVKLSVYHELPF